MSALVYRTECAAWRPDRFEEGVGPAGVHWGPVVNEGAKPMLFITEEHEEVPWGDVRQLRNREWHLYVVHWDQERGLLYVNSSNNGSDHEALAKAIASPGANLIKGERIFRWLHGGHPPCPDEPRAEPRHQPEHALHHAPRDGHLGRAAGRDPAEQEEVEPVRQRVREWRSGQYPHRIKAGDEPPRRLTRCGEDFSYGAIRTLPRERQSPNGPSMWVLTRMPPAFRTPVERFPNR